MPDNSQGGGLDTLVVDPQFLSLGPADQRRALAGVSGDNAFGQLSDADTARYVAAHRATVVGTPEWGAANAQQQAQSVSAKAVTQDQSDATRKTLSTLRAIQPYAETVGEVGKGALKGAGHTAADLYDAGAYLLGRPSDARNSPALKPVGTAQNVGYGLEQAGEFLLPGGAEDSAMEAAGKVLTSPSSRAIAKAGIEGLSSGLVNKAQGGGFGTGAITGAAFSGLGSAGSAIAPGIIRRSLGIGAKQLRHGATPGEAVLRDLSPGTITASGVAEEASQKATQLRGEMEHLVSDAAGHGVTGSTLPAKQVIKDEIDKAVGQNMPASSALRQKLTQLWQRVAVDAESGKNLKNDLPVDRLLAIKRGIGREVKSWTREEQIGMQPILQRVYGAIDGEIDRAVPESAELNQRISSLITAAKAAKKTAEKKPGILPTLGRVAWQGGVPLAGAGLGYEAGGTPGAAIGAAAGEMAAMPAARIGAARALGSPATPRLARGTLLGFLPPIMK